VDAPRRTPFARKVPITPYFPAGPAGWRSVSYHFIVDVLLGAAVGVIAGSA